MRSLKSFLYGLGDLHDGVVESIRWSPESRSIEFSIRDIWINFEGLPEYLGPTPGSITLKEISSIKFEIDFLGKSLNIFEFSVLEEEDVSAVTIAFWPAGKIILHCRSAEFPDIQDMSTSNNIAE
jgi:hypothetical protein